MSYSHVRVVAVHESGIGPTRTFRNVSFCAALRVERTGLLNRHTSKPFFY
jgi:hypothetical protein